jgi:hypothetical protein
MKRWLLAAVVLISQHAMGGGSLATPPNDAWKTECGSCHLA